MVRVIAFALLLLVLPVRVVEAKAFFTIEQYRSWSTDYRLGYVIGMLETAYVLTQELAPEGLEQAKPCFEGKSLHARAAEVDNIMMNYKPGARYDTANMSLPEYVEWAFQYVCTK